MHNLPHPLFCALDKKLVISKRKKAFFFLFSTRNFRESSNSKKDLLPPKKKAGIFFRIHFFVETFLLSFFWENARLICLSEYLPQYLLGGVAFWQMSKIARLETRF